MASSPNFSALLMEGFNTGREMKRQEGERNALSGLVLGDQGQLGELARYNPQMAMQYQQQQKTQMAAQQKAQDAKLKEAKGIVGQAALQIAQLPEAQRPQAWDQQIDYLTQQGYDGLAQYKGRYSPENLMGVISEAGLSNDLRTATEPRITAAVPGGYVIATDRMGNDPRYIMAPQGQPPAVATPNSGQPATQPQGDGNFADFNGGMRVLESMGPQKFIQWQQQYGTPIQVTTPEQMNALPSGTMVMGPNGEVRRKP